MASWDALGPLKEFTRGKWARSNRIILEALDPESWLIYETWESFNRVHAALLVVAADSGIPARGFSFVGSERLQSTFDPMLKIMPFLGLVLGMTACRAPAPVTEVSPRSEARGRNFPHLFLREHGGEPSLEPATRSALTAEDAAVLAARLANDQCERLYRRRPFKAEQYPVVLQGAVYCWGNLDVGGHEGFSASVVFYRDGSKPHVEVYFSSDTVLGVK